MLQCHVPQYESPLVPDLQAALNGDHTRLPALISELRYWMTCRRCEKTLQHLPATPHERLPLLHRPDHPMSKIGRHRMFVRLHRHPNVILIVELKEKESSPCEIDCLFYLAVVKHSSIEDDPHDDSIETEIPKMYLKVQTLIEFDTFVTTHGPFTSVDECGTSGKRKCMSGRSESAAKRSRHPAYFIPELAHVVALCDERIPFVTLTQELSRREIAHQGLQVEANATALVLRLVQLPPPPSPAPIPGWQALLKRLLSVSIRVYGKGNWRSWMAEFVMYGSPLASTNPKEQGMRRPVCFQYEMGTAENVSKTVDALLNDWAQIVHLYSLVEDLAEYFRIEKYNLSSMVTIKSYSYSKLVLAYGRDRGATVTVQWNSTSNAFTLIFGGTNSVNAHSLVREQLEAHLNRHRNLAQVVHLLHETYEPLVSISKLPTIPQLGVHNSRPQVPVQTFTVIPQSPTLIRLAYQGMYCLELRLKGGGLVSLRDGAYSRFDRTSVVNEFTPTPALKTFLSKYVDESAVFRRRSQSEDDNPPSPVTMDSSEGGGGGGGFLSGHHRGPQSPAQQREGLRFHPPLTPPSGSNPHTPASPHTANISQSTQHQSFGSSPATSFNLASPPSLPPNINPSPSMLPHPSPSSGLLANSPSNPLHVPSPMPTNSPGPSVPLGTSPASSFIQQGHTDGSPFPSSQSMTSPAASNWPGSPGMPRPSPRPGQSPGHPHPALHSPDHKSGISQFSRVLPQRSWAGAVPTLITHEALDQLCTPSPHPQGLPGPELCPLERFLGCVYMKRQLQRFIQNEDCLIQVPTNEPGVVNFKVDSLVCRVCLNPQHLQSLHIKVQSLGDHKDQWTMEELQVIEKFFDTRAAAPPFKPNALNGFGKMLNFPYNVLKDFVQILKLELFPSLVQQQQLKWTVQWCLRMPPSAMPIVPTGMAAVLVCRNKILFFLQITRVMGMQYGGGEGASLVLPLVYDVSTNITQLAEKRDPGPANAMTAASSHLKRFFERPHNHSECSIFPAVRDLLANLVLQPDPQVVSSPGMMGGPGSGQMQSPGMMHSPMSVVGQPGGPGGYPMGMPPMGQHPMMGPQ
ncbi:mediator of RNA polymerase II transcription subunit 14 [Nilaparvata lugens]|uniref:mediator of RNA polymerase II transcription subunit 14 n=1 Tax=Nilaparvata lugens TaxID=108931 RepID=UPI00193DEA94|nr:mediator of RNA polymerase II transcription subunit 14 [Nilaparvata lugens]